MKLKTITLRAAATLTIIMLLLAALPVSPAYAASSGPRNAGAGADVAGVGTVIWGNPGNITTVGTPYASMSVAAGATTHYLQGTGYGFTIPDGSTINGITVVINRQSSGRTQPFIRDNVVRLVKAGTIIGNNQAFTGSNWPTTALGTATYGSATDPWGTTWTAAEINAANFGVVLSAYNANTSRSRTATVDSMQITVNYTLPGTTTTVNCGGGTPVVNYGDSITCVATVVAAAGTNTPSGTVSWATNGSGSFAPLPCTLSGTGGTSTCSVSYKPSVIGSGSHLITATYGGDANFTGSSGTKTVTVNTRPVTVTADAKTKTYGNANPALTYQITSGSLIPGDAFTGALTREGGEAVDNYAILQGTLALPGYYDLTYNGANLTITPKAASVTPNSASKTYGDADPTLTGTLSGFLLADGITAAYSRTAGETVAGGPYIISALLSPAGVLGNYDITYNPADFTITPKAASVTPNAASKTYGDADPTLTGTLSGFLLADGVTTAYSRTAGETVAGSPYVIKAVLSPAGVLGNYDITYNPADFTITKATPTLSVTNSPVLYTGSPRTATVTGSVTGTVSNILYDNLPTAPTNAGTYAVTVDFIPNDTSNYNSLTGAAAGNFIINKATPTLSVTNSPLLYSGSPQSANVVGSVLGTVSNILYDNVATTPTNVGTYAVTANFAPNDATNYNSLTNASAGNFVINLASPALMLVKTATPTSFAKVGDVINYSYLLTNSGNVTLVGPFTVTDDKATATCPATASLAPAASVTCNASYTIILADVMAGSVTNTASGAGSFAGNPVVSNNAQATVRGFRLFIPLIFK